MSRCHHCGWAIGHVSGCPASRAERAMAKDPRSVCAHCGSPEVIRSEGAVTLVCALCIRTLGRIVVEPFAVPSTVRERLMGRSLDVVDLVAGGWRWTATWPGAGDGRLIRGGVA